MVIAADRAAVADTEAARVEAEDTVAEAAVVVAMVETAAVAVTAAETVVEAVVIVAAVEAATAVDTAVTTKATTIKTNHVIKQRMAGKQRTVDRDRTDCTLLAACSSFFYAINCSISRRLHCFVARRP